MFIQNFILHSSRELNSLNLISEVKFLEIFFSIQTIKLSHNKLIFHFVEQTCFENFIIENACSTIVGDPRRVKIR